MKHNESMLSKKVIINDLLCFVQNNLNILSKSSICHLCQETYMPDEINKAYEELKDNVQLFDPLFNYQKNNGNKQDLLNSILALFESKVCDSLQFVSCKFNMPRMNTYRDMLSISCVLNELKEIKQLMLEQTQLFTSGISRLSNELDLLKQNGLCKDIVSKGKKSFSSPTPESPTECMNIDSVALIPSSATGTFKENVDQISSAVLDNAEGLMMLENSSKSVEKATLPPADMKTDHLRCSLKRLSSTGKYYKKHSCKLCGYIGNLTDVTRHMRTHTGERPFACPFCSTKFTLRGNMIKHLARKHGTFLSRLPSSTKGKRYTSRKNKRNTDKSISTPSMFISNLSESNSATELELKDANDAEFTSTATSDPEIISVKPELLDDNFSSTSFALEMGNLDTNPVLGESAFSVPSSLIGDMTQASSAVATYNPMLHMQSTQQEDAPAASMQALDRFVTNQLQKKRHRCEICGYAGNASDVTRHKRTHTGERPYGCPVCSARFSLRGNMTKHVARMHSDYDGK